MTEPRQAERPLHIVLVHRYFAPDTPPYAAILQEIAGALAGRGHRVTVLTCQPSYRRELVARAPRREVIEGISVVRWPVLPDRRSTVLKLLNLLWFASRLLGSRRAIRDADVVMAATTPPVAIAFVSSLLARSIGARFIYHKQDIWPEVARSGDGAMGVVHRVLRWVDHRTERRASRVVVLSRDMAEAVQSRSREPIQTCVINNFDPWHIATEADESPSGPGLTLVFAGNLGRFQGIERLLDLVEETADDPRIEWHFFGDGPLAGLLADLQSRGTGVVLHGFRPAEEVAAFLRREGDLGVVSLNPGVIRHAYPSKTMSYLRNGCPLLALVEPESELAEMVTKEGIGLSGGLDDISTVAAALRQCADDPGVVRSMRARAREVYDERFAMSGQLEDWTRLFEDLAR